MDKTASLKGIPEIVSVFGSRVLYPICVVPV